MTDALPPVRKRRQLGCLPGLALLGVGSVIFYIAVNAVFAPWIYRVGGRMRLWPVWTGVGVAHAASGTYTFYIWFSPTPSGSRIYASTTVKGYGYLCTPHGEHYSLQLRGGTAERIWSDMDGHKFGLRAYYRPILWQLAAQVEQPPRLSFAGRWSGPDLVMTDEGSFDLAFQPDGTLNTHPAYRRMRGGGVPVTFTETAWWFRPDCPGAGG